MLITNCTRFALEERVPADHSLRAIRGLADEALVALNGRYAAMFAQVGRAPITPEMVLRVSLLQAFFSAQVRPEACLQHGAAGAEADRL